MTYSVGLVKRRNAVASAVPTVTDYKGRDRKT